MISSEIKVMLEKGDLAKAMELIDEAKNKGYPPGLVESYDTIATLYRARKLSTCNVVQSIRDTTTTHAERLLLGRGFLGPVLLTFYKRLFSKLLLDSSNNTLFFLAREGYFLKKGFDAILQHTHQAANFTSRYLLCSRVLLSRVSLSSDTTFKYIVRHNYNGSVRSFLLNRLNLRKPESYGIPRSILEQPYDATVIIPVLETLVELKVFEQDEVNYKLYLESLGFYSCKPSIVDLGYSATIQTLLTLFTGLPSTGFYLLTTASAYNNETRHLNLHGLLGGSLQWGQDRMLDLSIFLEALLTSPDGSAIGITNNNLDFAFEYGSHTAAQKRFQELEEIFSFSIDYVLEFWNHKSAVLNTLELKDLYVQMCGSRIFAHESVASLMEVEDNYSGNRTLTLSQFS